MEVTLPGPLNLPAPQAPPLSKLLLDSLRRMAAAGHQPGRYVVLRLTDGRVRAYALMDRHSSPVEMIGEIRNESGPVSSAFLVGSESSDGSVQFFVEDLLSGQRLEQSAGGFAGQSGWKELPDQPTARFSSH